MQDSITGEARLIEQARNGDCDAFAGLVVLHQERLRGLVALSISNREDIHDLVQETFVDAWRAISTFTAGSEFGPWLRTICRNRVRMFLRRRLPGRPRAIALIDESLLSAPEQAEDDRRLLALRGCLERLSDDQRHLLSRRYHDGDPVQAIAAATGRTPNSVSTLFVRLKSALLKCIEQRLVEGPA